MCLHVILHENLYMNFSCKGIGFYYHFHGRDKVIAGNKTIMISAGCSQELTVVCASIVVPLTLVFIFLLILCFYSGLPSGHSTPL